MISWPANAMRPASGTIRPEIWLIKVVLPAPFGPITACSSPGITSSVTSSVTRSPPKFLLKFSMRSTGSATNHPPQPLGDADQPAAREHGDQHQQWPENHLPVLGEAREPFLSEQECGRADDCPVKGTHTAEDHHDEQVARALPRHVGGADEVGRVAEQESGKARNNAGDHIHDELEAVDLEPDRAHA